MGMRLKYIIKLATPPVILSLSNRLLSNQHYGLTGDYSSWNEAMAASTGYDNKIILEKTKEAILKVKNGEVVYERDSVLFDEIQYAWPVLAGLMWVAARSGGRLNVMDFGGSLGSTYFQNRAFLSTLHCMRWNIVEQSSHVEIGKSHFDDDCLHFYSDITECLAATQPNAILLSSVLQYLEHPYRVLNQIQEIPCNYIIIDRTPFWDGLTDRLCVQTVPPNIYPASYPSWIFSTPRFHTYLNNNCKIIAEFDSFDNLNAPIKTFWRGFILEHKRHAK